MGVAVVTGANRGIDALGVRVESGCDARVAMAYYPWKLQAAA